MRRLKVGDVVIWKHLPRDYVVKVRVKNLNRNGFSGIVLSRNEIAALGNPIGGETHFGGKEKSQWIPYRSDCGNYTCDLDPETLLRDEFQAQLEEILNEKD